MAGPDHTDDERWMELALHEADRAAEAGDVPVGAVLVDGSGKLLARGRNQREAKADPTAHAEIEALRSAARQAGGWRLTGTTLVVTLEPCVMCAGALVHARVGRLVYGCDDDKAGAVSSLFVVGRDPRLNHRFEVTRGVLADACADRLRRFFAARR
ncbi:MAG: nucleoside deaminase [Deltaproteobacteria bacterium]|jgi:tRNA(adenine34) deaminase|nr:nucleoside deaminase [Deltaproteobacteria bacterium]MBW2536587.1 nucleoside deaminase [Deltaproteobacteria bacterium]